MIVGMEAKAVVEMEEEEAAAVQGREETGAVGRGWGSGCEYRGLSFFFFKTAKECL